MHIVDESGVGEITLQLTLLRAQCHISVSEGLKERQGGHRIAFVNHRLPVYTPWRKKKADLPSTWVRLILFTLRVHQLTCGPRMTSSFF
jgi:hypothetical protein